MYVISKINVKLNLRKKISLGKEIFQLSHLHTIISKWYIYITINAISKIVLTLLIIWSHDSKNLENSEYKVYLKYVSYYLSYRFYN